MVSESEGFDKPLGAVGHPMPLLENDFISLRTRTTFAIEDEIDIYGEAKKIYQLPIECL